MSRSDKVGVAEVVPVVVVVVEVVVIAVVVAFKTEAQT